MRVILFFISLLSATAGHAFDVNVSQVEIDRFRYGVLAADLAVGDVASVFKYQFCVIEDGKLVYPKSSALTKSDYGHFIIKVEPKNQISLTRNQNLNEDDGTPDRFSVIVNTTECEKTKLQLGYFEVNKIDGTTNMKDYLKTLKDAGFTPEL